MLRAHIDKLRIIYTSDICESGAKIDTDQRFYDNIGDIFDVCLKLIITRLY